MKYIISERQYNLLSEQLDSRMPFQPETFGYNPKKPETTNAAAQKQKEFFKSIDPHTLAMILGIGSAFIPVVGPFISVGIGFADAALYYQEGDTKTAGLVAAFSLLPGLAIANKIPGVKELGAKGMVLLASKIGSGAKLTKAEIEIAGAIKNFTPKIQDELSKMGPKLKKVIEDVQKYKGNFVKKYGESEYNTLLAKYLYGGIDDVGFLSKLKSVKAPNIKVKPILGGGRDHRVFQSAVNPNLVFKAELRPGEINKWYDMFKKYPNLFAQTFRKVKVKGNNGELLDAVEMEKLDTSKFMGLWETMSSKLGEFQSKMGPSNQDSLEELVKSINGSVVSDLKWKKFIPYFKQQYPNLSKQMDEFSKIVQELYKITPNPDIRKFNLGYDSKGVLKALDI
jgi:hypothetical protein